jgi:hypothetical protein
VFVITQSAMNRLGFHAPWQAYGYRDQLDIAARVLRASDKPNDALLIEFNNPVAIAKIRYVNDVPKNRY